MKFNPHETSFDKDELDKEASELGMGGELAPEKDISLYKERMKTRQEVQKKWMLI